MGAFRKSDGTTTVKGADGHIVTNFPSTNAPTYPPLVTVPLRDVDAELLHEQYEALQRVTAGEPRDGDLLALTGLVEALGDGLGEYESITPSERYEESGSAEPCSDFAPDSGAPFADDRLICTTCFHHEIDHYDPDAPGLHSDFDGEGNAIHEMDTPRGLCYECDAPATHVVRAAGYSRDGVYCHGCALVETGETQAGYVQWFNDLPADHRIDQNDHDGMQVHTINGIDVLGVDAGPGYCPNCEEEKNTFYEVTDLRWQGIEGQPLTYMEDGRYCTDTGCGEEIQFDNETDYIDALRSDADAERGEPGWGL